MPGDDQRSGGSGLPVGRLTARMAKGDERAWTEFHERYFSRLLGYLIVLHRGDEVLARESLQQTYLRVVRHVRRFDVEQVFWSWLTRLARCVVIDGARKSRRYAGLMDRVARVIEVEQSPAAEPGMVLVVLEECLGRWREDDRGMLEKKYFEQWSHADLAVEFHTTPKAIESRLARLRAKLKQCMIERLKHV